jgi:hypothetical protein
MGITAFMERSYRIGPDGRTVLCDAIAGRGDIGALRDALGWKRDEIALVGLDGADAVLQLRALMALDDMLAAPHPAADEALLTLTRPQMVMLCEIAGAYVTDRDVESYQPPEERHRIAGLRALAGPLMDSCCELAAAEDEARERLLLV